MLLRRSDTKIAQLAGVEAFEGCNRHQLEKIGSLVDEADFPTGSALMREGHTGRECFVVVSGEADVSIRGERIARIGPGDITGEMALISHQPRSATVKARTDVRALVLTSQSLNAVLDTAPAVTRHVMRALAERLRKVQRAA